MTNSYQISLRHIQRNKTIYFSSFIPSLWVHVYLHAYILLIHISSFLPFLLVWVLIPHTCIISCWSLLSNSAHTSIAITNSNHNNSCFRCCLMLLFVRICSELAWIEEVSCAEVLFCSKGWEFDIHMQVVVYRTWLNRKSDYVTVSLDCSECLCYTGVRSLRIMFSLISFRNGRLKGTLIWKDQSSLVEWLQNMGENVENI